MIDQENISPSNNQLVLGILRKAIGHLQQSRLLWVLGFISALASDGLGIVMGRLLSAQLPDRATLIAQPEQLFDLLFKWSDLLINHLLWVGIIMLLAVLLLGYLWTLVVNAQAAQIETVLALEKGEKAEFKTVWQNGRPFIGRLIGVDTLAFLPLFLLLLLILFLLSGLFLTLILILEESIGLSPDALPYIGLAGLCVIPLIILILPTLLLTILFRLIGMRFAVLEDVAAREALRRVRPWLRQHIGPTIFWGLVSLASWYLLGLVSRMIGIGLSAIAQGLSFGAIKIFAELGQVSVHLLIGTARLSFISVLWTLAYLRLKEQN